MQGQVHNSASRPLFVAWKGVVSCKTKTGAAMHPGEMGEVAALDLGCSTGATTFELARCFHVVVGVDQAQHFINAAKVGGAAGWGLPPTTVCLM